MMYVCMNIMYDVRVRGTLLYEYISMTCSMYEGPIISKTYQIDVCIWGYRTCANIFDIAHRYNIFNGVVCYYAIIYLL